MSVVRGAGETHGNQDAINNASQAIHRDPRNANAYCARAAAPARLDKGQTKQAIADTSKAIALDPENAEAYRIRGNAQFLRNENVAALHDLSEAIGLDPSISDAYATICYAFRQATGMVNDHLVTCPRHAELGGARQRKQEL